LCCHAADVSDEASATHIRAGYATANTDHIIRCDDTTACTRAKATLKPPELLLKSALKPFAVLNCPVVSAQAPEIQ